MCFGEDHLRTQVGPDAVRRDSGAPGTIRGGGIGPTRRARRNAAIAAEVAIPTRFVVKANLATLLHTRGNYAESLKLAREILDVRRQVLRWRSLRHAAIIRPPWG